MKKNLCYISLYPVAADMKDNGLIQHIVMKWLSELSRHCTVKCYFEIKISNFHCGKRVCGSIWRTVIDILRQTTYKCSHNCRSKARNTKNKTSIENITSQP
jgi:hypothetical protein